MSKVVVVNHVTLDGVMQAPARPDEDPRGGFEHGGWAVPYYDPVMAGVMGQRMAKSGGALLLGRRTYEDFAAVWPNRTDNPITEKLNRTRKYVASTTLKEPLPWVNSTLLPGDAAEAVAELKQQSDEELTVLGSGRLIHSLMRRGLIDEYLLTIHPLVLGTGRRLFPHGVHAVLRLVEEQVTTTGVVIANYHAADGTPAGTSQAGDALAARGEVPPPPKQDQSVAGR
jgi:dihydrofolate reductase